MTAFIASKLMMLTLLAIFKDTTMDADSYIAPVTLEECQAQGRQLAEQWKARDERIIAVAVECAEHDDIRLQLYAAHPELLPMDEPEPPMPIPGDRGA